MNRVIKTNTKTPTYYFSDNFINIKNIGPDNIQAD